MHHPTAAEPQALIEPCAERSHLRRRGRHHVRTTIRPSSQKGPVLLKKDAILDQCIRQQQISKTSRRSPMFVSVHLYLEIKQDKAHTDDWRPCAHQVRAVQRQVMGG